MGHPPGPLTVQDQALVDAAGDPSTHATLLIGSDIGSVDFGANIKYENGDPTSINRIDVADTAKLADAGLSPGNAIAHEALEASAIAGSATFSNAHVNNPVTGFTFISSGFDHDPSTGDGTGGHYTVSVGKGGPQYNVTTTFRTPIPAAAFSPNASAALRQNARSIMQNQADVKKVEPAQK